MLIELGLELESLEAVLTLVWIPMSFHVPLEALSGLELLAAELLRAGQVAWRTWSRCGHDRWWLWLEKIIK